MKIGLTPVIFLLSACLVFSQGCDDGGYGLASADCGSCQDIEILQEGLLPPIDAVWEKIRAMSEMGVRLTGSPAHSRYINFLADELMRIGCTDLQRDSIEIERWEPISWGLSHVLPGGQEIEPVPVAGYYPYSGVTDANGIIGEMVYRNPGDLSSIQGKIVLMDGVIPNLTVGLFVLLATYVHEPDPFALLRLLGEDYRRPWLSLAAFTPDLGKLKEAGALGLVLAVDLPAEEADGQYIPFNTPYKDLPAVLVDRATGSWLKAEINSSFPFHVRLTMEARLEKTFTHHLTAFLRGRTDSLVVLNSHTDGQNAVEENGAIGLIALGEYFANLPLCCREKTLCFSFVSGHFQAQVRDNEDWIQRHPEIIEKMEAALVIEHLGTTQWEESPSGSYGSTGRSELAAMFVSRTPALVDAAISAVKSQDLRRVAVIEGSSFGVGKTFLHQGLPMISYLSGPTYLLSTKNGGMDKLDKERMNREIKTFVEIVLRLNRLPAGSSP